jgi:hypothetical protein
VVGAGHRGPLQGQEAQRQPGVPTPVRLVAQRPAEADRVADPRFPSSCPVRYRHAGRGGKVVYDVIDGKQRIETILWWLGKGPLAGDQVLDVRTALDEGEPLDYWTWSDLSKDWRHRFYGARIPVVEVEGDFNDVIELFVRLNSTGKPLTSAEKQHARFFQSPTLKTAQRLAKKYGSWLDAQRVITAAQAQRMKDLELMTELLLSVHADMPLNKKGSLDRILAGHGLSKTSLEQAAADLSRALRVLQKVLPGLKTTRFHQRADFYTLVLLLHRLRREGRTVTAHDSERNRIAGALLTEFGAAVDRVNEKSKTLRATTKAEEPFAQYLLTVKEGTDSQQQRLKREKLLRQVIESVFDHKDPNRAFNSTQRRILWHAANDPKCHFPDCKSPKIKRWEDLHIDHLRPHVKGGQTVIGNAALAHGRCNQRWGAKGAP